MRAYDDAVFRYLALPAGERDHVSDPRDEVREARWVAAALIAPFLG